MTGCSLAQVAPNKMSFRPYLLGITVLGIIALATLFLFGETSVQAQTTQAQATTDFTAWKCPQNAESVHGWVRLMLVRDFRSVTGTAREELLARTLSALKDIASDSNVVPSTRYNAILAAGQLISREPIPGNPPVPPIAYPAALLYLIDVYRDPNTPDYLKYGALLGIVRHANIGIDPALQDKAIDLLLETVTTEFEPREMTLDTVPLEPAVWDWFRLTALDGLAALRTVGTDGRIVTELLSVINRQSRELEDLFASRYMLTREEWEQSRRSSELASKAAKTLGDLRYTLARDTATTDAETMSTETIGIEAMGIDARKMTDAFIRLTKAVCDIERKIATDSLEPSEQDGPSPNPALLLERIAINLKMSTQSVVWGIRSSLLTGRPTEDSFYASLEPDDPSIRRLDILLAEIIKLATFLDEGDGTRRPVLSANVPREFQFNLSELRDVLATTSEVLAEILREEEGLHGVTAE